MTTAEAAAQLHVSLRGVQKMIQRGTLKAERRGRDWWITPAAVELARARAGSGRPRKREPAAGVEFSKKL
jgi:excisionase family DNA binding protein